MSITYPTAQRYIDITACSLGATLGINSVREISFKVNTKKIEGSGDADKALTFLAKGMVKLEGSIKIDDPVQATALLSQPAGVFVFTGLNPNTSKVLTVTINGVQFFDFDDTAKHDDLHTCSISFTAFAATGALFTMASA